ncbi:Bcr/CflA family efflux MFS transporter [Demequina sp. NBRC 110056]|uniref:Bcr/CflA family efflux MFS transporter n=1 Tax=Demequina sp. NBRC 110056 TaxID=1570345 RepID=UPI001356585B|nr:Bcr/CflA family efflux MFS transporter [Demequina sp. NBRC 110056]
MSTAGPETQGLAAHAVPVARLLPLLAVLTALGPLSVDIYTPSLPAMQAELGGTEALTQASITTFLLGIGLGQLVWGPLSDRIGRRPVILVGVGAWAIACLLAALAVSPGMLIAVRLVAGLCAAAGIAVARSVVRDVSPSREVMASRIGLLSMVTALAPVLAPVVGAGIAALWGWRADFVAMAAIGGVTVLAYAWLVPETLPASAQGRVGASVAGGLRAAVADRELRGVAIALGVHSFGFYAYVTTTAFIVEDEFGHPPATFALVFGTNALAVIVGNQVFRRLVRRRHPSAPLGAGLVLCTVAGLALALLALAGAPELTLWAASMAYALGQGLVLPGAHAWAQVTVVASGAASALAGSLQFLGGVLGSPVTGLLGPTARTLGVVTAAASGIAVLAWAATRRHVPVHAPEAVTA